MSFLDMLILRKWDIQWTDWNCRRKIRARGGSMCTSGCEVHSHRDDNCDPPGIMQCCGAHQSYLSYNY